MLKSCNNGHVKNFCFLSKKALVTSARFLWVGQELEDQALSGHLLENEIWHAAVTNIKLDC